ncbi:polysaccharide biosynthesis protein [Alicyclobacillaceae bacterium I2511]|nr:polysaccharide biosynthesis protein [Alicyclobacillaceae bacterium I2511]
MVLNVFLSKLLGIVYIIPLTRLIGSEGMGVYSNAYALYTFFLTLATAGFPTAMGKIISERLAQGRLRDADQIYRATLQTVTVFGVVLFFLMWFGAPVYGHLVAFSDSTRSVANLVPSVRAVALCLLVVPVMSALRGYLQGYQRIEPIAYSQSIEQVIRIVTMLVGAYLAVAVTGKIAYGAAAATFGAVPGAAVAVLYLAYHVRYLRRTQHRREEKRRTSTNRKYTAGSSVLREELSGGGVGLNREYGDATSGNRTSGDEKEFLRPYSRGRALRDLARVAIPVSIATLVVPISGFIDSVTVQNVLMWSGFSYTQATEAYGILSRQAMQLVQLPLAFAMALGITVLPAISADKAVGNQNGLQEKVLSSLRSVLFLTFPVAAALLTLARPLDVLLFGSTQGQWILAGVSFMGIFSGLELMSTYILQGLGVMYLPVRNMFIGLLIKVVLNLVLIYPFHAIGAAIATTVGYVVSSSLNLQAVKKFGGFRSSLWKLALPGLDAVTVLALVFVVIRWLGSDLASQGLGWTGIGRAVVQLLLAVMVGAPVYAVTAVKVGAISNSEALAVPILGRFLSLLYPRLSTQKLNQEATVSHLSMPDRPSIPIHTSLHRWTDGADGRRWRERGEYGKVWGVPIEKTVALVDGVPEVWNDSSAAASFFFSQNQLTDLVGDERTLQDWEKAYGIRILDFDGFTESRQDLLSRRLTRREFEHAATHCTIVMNIPKLATQHHSHRFD